MEGSEIAQAVATEATRQTVKGILAPFIEGGRSKRRQRELQADVTAIERLHETGIDVTYFKGLVMEAETERQYNNVNSALEKADALIDWGNLNPEGVNPEFQFEWVNNVRNISDETLQGLFARLLAGELETPESVSNFTMSVVRSMDATVAKEFQLLCSAALRESETGKPLVTFNSFSPGLAPLYALDYLSPYGPTARYHNKTGRTEGHAELRRFSVLHRLVVDGDSASIVGAFDYAYHFFPYALCPQNGSWELEYSGGSMEKIPHGIVFTKAGHELGRVVETVPVPRDYLALLLRLMRNAGYKVTPSGQGNQ